MNIRAALNHYLSNYDLIFSDIIEAILGKTTESLTMYDKTIASEKQLLREYLEKLMTTKN